MITNVNLTGGVIGASLFPMSTGPRGAIIYVNSAIGQDSRRRLTYPGGGSSLTQGSTVGPIGDPSYPLASVFGANGALTLCKAGRGDIIFVDIAHTENLTINQVYAIPDGVTIVGSGYGSQRPTFTITGNAGTTITPGKGCQIYNCIFDGTGIAAVTSIFTLNATGNQFVNCRFVQASVTNQASTAILFFVGSDDAVFSNCEVDGTAAAITGQAILSAGGASINRPEFTNCFIHGNYSASCMNIANASPFKEALIWNCSFRNLAAGTAAVVNFGTGTTGNFENNYWFAASAASTVATIVSTPSNTSMGFFQCFGIDAGANADKNGILAPAAAAALP